MQTNPLLVVNVTSIDKFYGSSNIEPCTGVSQDSPNCYCTDISYPTNCTPQLCVSNEQTYPCICTVSHQPPGCTCPTVPAELVGIPIERCQCNSDNDPRRGITCAVTRVCEQNDKVSTPCLCSSQYNSGNCTCTQNHHSDQQCICDISGESGVYDLSTCRSTKTCIDGDFDNPLPVGCTATDCSSQNQTFECNCKPGLDPIGCNCPSDVQQLVSIRTEACPCNGDNDPRRGITCAVSRL
ncbi:MAG: hypothetical protein EZS28_053539, partial [Streblomastix strix]